MADIQEKDNSNNNDSSFTKKRNRKHSAQTLPQGLEHHMMKKYVVYYREWIDRSHTKEREYFKIEKHPDLPKTWTSTKSNKVKLTDKLAEPNKIVEDLEKKRKEELEKQNEKCQ
jgi:phosphatidate phosphatase PAH1